jgi:hypothetical protein
VWFEPTIEAHYDDERPEGEIFEFDPDQGDGPDIADRRRMPVRLLGVPARLFGELRRYHFELRRELRLLAMAAPEDYPLAVSITEIFSRADLERRSSLGIDELDAAIARGADRVDLDYRVPLTAPHTMSRATELIAELYREFSQENLLSLRPPDQLVELQSWYFGEFVRQAAGEAPIRWTGAVSLPRSVSA